MYIGKYHYVGKEPSVQMQDTGKDVFNVFTRNLNRYCGSRKNANH